MLFEIVASSTRATSWPGRTARTARISRSQLIRRLAGQTINTLPSPAAKCEATTAWRLLPRPMSSPGRERSAQEMADAVDPEIVQSVLFGRPSQDVLVDLRAGQPATAVVMKPLPVSISSRRPADTMEKAPLTAIPTSKTCFI
ncbi:MAG: hypothetical protein PHR30_14990 [Gallionellaceae bacterium]|nr:hypothetical protein [Gallionellaceae bacterium]